MQRIRTRRGRQKGENERDAHCLDGNNVWAYVHGYDVGMRCKKVHFDVHRVVWSNEILMS